MVTMRYVRVPGPAASVAEPSSASAGGWDARPVLAAGDGSAEPLDVQAVSDSETARRSDHAASLLNIELAA